MININELRIPGSLGLATKAARDYTGHHGETDAPMLSTFREQRSGDGTYRAARIFMLVTSFTLVSGCSLPFSKKAEDEPVVPPVEPCPAITSAELEREAIALLDAGESETARRRLECALELDEDSSRAQLLLEQMDADPEKYLDQEFQVHTVKSGETLSLLADRCLGSSLKFVILARYNGIDVPRDMVAGQRIKVPAGCISKAQPAEPQPQERARQLYDEGRRAWEENDLEKARSLMDEAIELDDTLVGPTEEDRRAVKAALVKRYAEEAYRAEAQTGPEEAKALWKRVLELDPENVEAQVNLRRLNGPR